MSWLSPVCEQLVQNDTTAVQIITFTLNQISTTCNLFVSIKSATNFYIETYLTTGKNSHAWQIQRRTVGKHQMTNNECELT